VDVMFILKKSFELVPKVFVGCDYEDGGIAGVHRFVGIPHRWFSFNANVPHERQEIISYP
jgi:hypothetical protein